jgi:ATP-dependent Clp protease ATP-binding subunit ClpC
MFERFTDRARRVAVLAQEEARLLNHNYIGTEHILLGLIHEGEGVAAKALQSLDISLEAVRQQVEEIIGAGGSSPGQSIPFTPRAKQVLELSVREATTHGHDYIGTEHILLGLIREGEGVAIHVLVKIGANPDRVRAKVLELLAGGAADATVPGQPLPPPSAALRQIMDEARQQAVVDGAPEVAPVHLFWAAVHHPDGAAGRMLRDVGVDPDDLRRRVLDESTDDPGDESG